MKNDVKYVYKCIACARDLVDTPSEKALEDRLKREAKKKGLLTLKFESPGNTGVPDRVVIGSHGLVAFIELKKGKEGRIAAKQKYWQNEFRKRGLFSYIVKNTSEMEEALKEIKEEDERRKQ